MQMNQPVWFVEDSKLMASDEGKKKLQEVADANSKSSSRLTILHGGDFDKASSCIMIIVIIIISSIRCVAQVLSRQAGLPWAS